MRYCLLSLLLVLVLGACAPAAPADAATTHAGRKPSPIRRPDTTAFTCLAAHHTKSDSFRCRFFDAVI
nr:hypothetical protein [uncultured Agathobaculum sp.]